MTAFKDRRVKRSRRGYFLLIAALMIVVLFAIAGLAVDASYFQLMKQRAQSAADAAAMGGMQELRLGHTPENAVLAGKNDASFNGFTDGQDGITVTINNPPSEGPNRANNHAVEAIVSRNVPTMFMNIFGQRSITVRARAVAMTNGSGTGLSGSIYALDGRDGSPGDPLAAVQAPTSGTIVSASPASYDVNRAPAGNRLQPGVYCGGLSVENTDGVTYTMMPGTYIMAGGGLTFNSQVRIAGRGVTIYVTSSAAWGCAENYAYQPVTIDGQANVVLSAPTTGPLTGVLFFMDRSIRDSRENKIAGGRSTTLDGALYFKNAPLTFSGNNPQTRTQGGGLSE